jgi:hypothetical protein
MANLGPSTTVTSNAVAVLTPVSTVTNPGPQGAQALRLLGVAKGVSGNATGDAAVMQIINASTWLPVSMITANSQLAGVSGSVATLAIGLFTAAAAGGTAIKSNAALAGNTGATAAYSWRQRSPRLLRPRSRSSSTWARLWPPPRLTSICSGMTCRPNPKRGG